MKQKTWIDLLGRNTDYVHVDGCDIVRGFEECERLWTFDTPEQAEENFKAWLHEIIAEQDAKIVNRPPPGTWASVAALMAAGDDSGFDWDAWKDEMKERDL